jgi:hypothetical protein
MKPVFSVTQAVIDRTAKLQPPCDFIGFKQLYSAHYFDGAFGLAVLAEQSSSPTGRAVQILYINHNHPQTDALGGWLGPIKRAITNRRSGKCDAENPLDLNASL